MTATTVPAPVKRKLELWLAGNAPKAEADFARNSNYTTVQNRL